VEDKDTRMALKVLSNKHRFAIMKVLLSAPRDLCVHELSENIGISQSSTSHQLAYLQACGVVEGSRMGRTKCYVPTNEPLTRKIANVIHTLTK